MPVSSMRNLLLVIGCVHLFCPRPFAPQCFMLLNTVYVLLYGTLPWSKCTLQVRPGGDVNDISPVSWGGRVDPIYVCLRESRRNSSAYCVIFWGLSSFYSWWMSRMYPVLAPSVFCHSHYILCVVIEHVILCKRLYVRLDGV